jgi:hypothetical protein
MIGNAVFRAGAILMLLAVCMPSPAGATGDIYFCAAGGASYPITPNLSDELSLQGTDAPDIGWTASVSLGRSFAGGAFAAELWAEVSRYPYFPYVNEYEEFDGDLTDYSFLLFGKWDPLASSSERFFPWIGLGAGYGQATISRGGGKIAGFQAAALLQLETVLRDNISLLVEGSYLIMPGSKEFDSPFLEGSALDRILDSGGEPISEQFSSVNLRVGIVVRLKPPDPYR